MKSFDIEKLIFDLNDYILNTNHSISSDSNGNKRVIKISQAFMNTLNKYMRFVDACPGVKKN